MLIIQGIVVDESIIRDAFVCDLNSCQGACCWEGDYGAPLDQDEVRTIDEIFPVIEAYLPDENKALIAEKGKTSYYDEPKFEGTSLFDDGRCAYMTRSSDGIAVCAFESAYRAQATSYPKPLSCQLYPIRAKRCVHTGMETLSYDRWSICAAACTKGDRLKVPVYQFVKSALIRKYGQGFYDELDAAAQHLTSNEGIRTKI